MVKMIHNFVYNFTIKRKKCHQATICQRSLCSKIHAHYLLENTSGSGESKAMEPKLHFGFTDDEWGSISRWEVASQKGPCLALCRKVVSFSPHTPLMRKILYYASFTIKGTETRRAKSPVQVMLESVNQAVKMRRRHQATWPQSSYSRPFPCTVCKSVKKNSSFSFYFENFKSFRKLPII